MTWVNLFNVFVCGFTASTCIATIIERQPVASTILFTLSIANLLSALGYFN